MKKLLFTGALCLFVSFSFAQKKSVNSAKNEIKGNSPNVEEARTLIKGALADPETENVAETWYVAGLIENKVFDTEKTKEIIGTQPNDPVMYGALDAIYPYFKKALELDQLPDEKGKVKPKHTKDIKAIMKANRPFYINSGLYYYENKDYKKAYENFKIYGDIPQMEIFKDEKWPVIEGDSTDLQVKYYAGLMASLIPEHEAAISIFEEIKNSGMSENEIYQRLCYEYEQVGDNANFEKTVKEGFRKFPGEEYYVLSLINISINKGNNSEAVSYLESAIAEDPNNPQLFDVLGQVYENGKDNENAIKYLKKSLEIDPNYIEANSHMGRVYYNMGVEARALADNSSDDAVYKSEFEKSREYFRMAMPYYEKVYSLKADDSDAIFALRSIYYNLEMGTEFEKMDALYNAQ